jgi:hypothetical protein
MISKSWLLEQMETTDVRELAKHELAGSGISDSDLQKLVADGLSPRWMEKWRAFIGKMVMGDELWFFESPPESWQAFQGRRGYALIRSGQIVASIVSSRS